MEDKQAKARQFAAPKTIKELQKFLGTCNYYRSYIQDFAAISKELYEALKGNYPILVWTDVRNKAFEHLKHKVSSNVSLHIADYDKPFILTTDASTTGLGAVLQQEIDGQILTIDWASRKLTPAEQKYGITEKEFMAVAWAFQHYDYYLRGRKFNVLAAIRNKNSFGTLKLERMRERLQEYDFDVAYKQGSEIGETDTLSREKEPADDYSDAEKKSKNFVKSENGECYWKNRDNSIRIIPKQQDRAELINKLHV
ncbi:hypothetical protein ENBRE01_2739 [Enteropsectra breve]|nr:hypothetical protein ENBRE01_2739 [Enteropsectra breve]